MTANPARPNPARWHRDPSGRHQLRYWDGRAWTEHVSDGGVTSRDPIPRRKPAGNLMPSSEGRSTPATHEPRGVGLGSRPRRTQPTRPAPTGRAPRPTRPRRSTTRRAGPFAAKRPTPIITQAGWSTRTKLLVAFIAADALIASVVIWLVSR